MFGFKYLAPTITEVTVPATYKGKPVIGIGNNAFSGRSLLETINLPESITSIGKSAFASCQSLKTINIPKKVTSLGESVFKHCYKLSTIKLPSKIENILAYAFYECYALKEVLTKARASIPELKSLVLSLESVTRE